MIWKDNAKVDLMFLVALLIYWKAPCKAEDFRGLSESIQSLDEALFIRHINSRWLTLSGALDVVLKRWTDAKKYFLEHVPKQKKYKKTVSESKSKPNRFPEFARGCGGSQNINALNKRVFHFLIYKLVPAFHLPVSNHFKQSIS